MRERKAIVAALALTAAALALALLFGGHSEPEPARAEADAQPGQPAVQIISPRNGARQTSHAVVVRVAIENFQLAPQRFGGEPQLDQGHLRYSLNRVPDCVDPAKLKRAVNSPIGKGRLIGNSFDYPRYSGPNGVLAERTGTVGSYSPGTRPVIFYRGLPPGFYRMIVSLAQNNGATTPFHAVTTFQILSQGGHGPKPCPADKVPSAKAAASLR